MLPENTDADNLRVCNPIKEGSRQNFIYIVRPGVYCTHARTLNTREHERTHRQTHTLSGGRVDWPACGCTQWPCGRCWCGGPAGRTCPRPCSRWPETGWCTPVPWRCSRWREGSDTAPSLLESFRPWTYSDSFIDEVLQLQFNNTTSRLVTTTLILHL